MDTIVVTGAFSNTGKYVTRLLLSRGYQVRTLTNHVERENPFDERVKVFPYNFHDPEQLRRSLRGASTLINTYWVRFPHGASTFEAAIQNTRTLITAAKDAGVRRIVHVSIANPSVESQLSYYKGKAQLEQSVINSGLSYAILRPTVIFGSEDILINNMAWFIRRFPVFAIPGDGRYAIRPIYVEDMARLIADAVGRSENAVLDAVGPETFAFEELVKLIAEQVRRSVRLVHLPMPLAYVATLVTGWFVGDVILTWEEYQGLMGNLLASEGSSVGQTRLSAWLAENHEQVGRRYASEVARHYARSSGGQSGVTLISAFFLSLWLAMMIPKNLGYASTWKERYCVFGHALVQNNLMPLGFANLGIVVIGLIVLWAGYRKNERWAWFVMLIILLCCFFPSSSLPTFLHIRADSIAKNQWTFSLDFFAPFREKGWWHCLAIQGSCSQVVGIKCIFVLIQLDILRFFAASVALLLPVKAFFWNKHTPAVSQQHREEDSSSHTNGQE